MTTAIGQSPRAWVDRTLLLVVPAAAFMLLLFVYPFLYGLVLSFNPKEGGWLANYRFFFTTDNEWPTIWTTLKLALPATLINVGLALPIAYKMRVKTRYQRWVTTILVVPITLGTVLIAEGMLTYFGPKGWLSQFLQFFHLYDGPIRLTHNYWGVLISLVISCKRNGYASRLALSWLNCAVCSPCANSTCRDRSGIPGEPTRTRRRRSRCSEH